MGRPVTSGLQALLDLPACDTQTTLSIYPVTGSPVHIATDAFTADGKTFAKDLRAVEDIIQSINTTPSRANAEAQNVDKTFGLLLASESLAKATAVIGRFFRKPDNFAVNEWRELFSGQVIPLEIVEGTARLEVLHDLVAAGYCVANWSLAENCQFVYKHAGTCGHTGSEPTCNKKRKSPLGCAGKIVTGTTTNEYRFGGMEFPDVQVASPPVGGGPGDDPGGDDPPRHCPRIDQWVLVRGRSWKPVPKMVRDLVQTDELFNPLWKTFHAIEGLRIVPNQPIWSIESVNRAVGYSSFTHPAFPRRGHETGIPVSQFAADDPLLTWASGGISDDRVSLSRDADSTAEVMHIALLDGRVYCYSDRPQGPYIVCHNKPWDGGGIVY